MYMRARHLIFLFVLLACFLLPCHAGQAEEGAGACPKPFIRSIFPWTARPGDVVTIQGERFGMPRGEVIFTDKVSFPLELLLGDEVEAEIVYWTFRRILVKVPQSAATGAVFIKVHCGAESNKLNFTVRKKQ
ncbi:MAG: hypothetical protein MUP30_13575 [Deltaproteobacteria bacterium]|nr:hypothetical protein [Deltaproteobacteria bacterium]